MTGKRRDADEQARLEAALRDMFEQRIAFNAVLGLQIDTFDAVEPRAHFRMRPELVGHFAYGRLHGGVISAALDAMGGFALMCAITEKHADEPTAQVLTRFARMGTIDLRIDYLRPGMGKVFHASARTLRLGGRIGNTQMYLHDEDGQLLATGAAAYVIS